MTEYYMAILNKQLHSQMGHLEFVFLTHAIVNVIAIYVYIYIYPHICKLIGPAQWWGCWGLYFSWTGDQAFICTF